MNAYFTASIVGKSHYLSQYELVIDALKRHSITVQSDHILHTTPEQIRFETKKERDEFHERLSSWIKESDFVVVEATFPSISVGYEISLALSHHKPVLVLYSEGDPPSLLYQHLEDKVVCEHYTPEDIDQLIEDFLTYIGETTDSRFTFFLTPTLAKYLEERSREERLPKAAFLRRLIDDDKQRHSK